MGGHLPSSAVEIDGKVEAVDGKTLRVSVSGDLLPVAGDAAEIVLRIPGLDQTGTIATGEVTLVLDESIVVTVGQTTGKLAVGQLAKIESANPVQRKPAPPNGEPLPIPPDENPNTLTGQSANSRQTVKAVATITPKMHLSAHPLDDEIAERTLSNFLRALDPMKLYFTKADVDRFLGSVAELDDQFRRGELDLMYDILNSYLVRLDERVEMARDLIDTDHNFDLDEEFTSSGDHRDFAAAENETREFWRERIKYDLLVLIAGGSDVAEARNKVRNRFVSFQNRMHRTNDADLLEMAMVALTNAYDPHSTFISQQAYANFVIQQQQLAGIGAALKSEDGYTHVTYTFIGSVDRILDLWKPARRCQ